MRLAGPLDALMGRGATLTEHLQTGQPLGDPQFRLRQLQGLWQQYPGRAPGGTGPTGLLPGDARGWSQVLNDQTEARELRGQPLTTRRGPNLGGMPENLAQDPNWWLRAMNTGPFTPTVESFPSAMQGLLSQRKK